MTAPRPTRIQGTRFVLRQLQVLVPVLGCLACREARAGVDTRVVLDIGVRGEVLGSDLDTRFQIEGSRFSGLGASLSGNGISGAFGKVPTFWDELSLARSGFNGLNAAISNGRLSTTLLGGTVVGRRLQGGSTASPLYGLRSTWKFNQQLSLSASGLMALGASEDEGPFIGAVALAYQPRASSGLSIETAHSRGGKGWQMAAQHRGKRASVRALVRDVDEGFSTAANPNLRTRRSGFSLSTGLRAGGFSLSAGSRRFASGRGGIRGGVAQSSEVRSSGGRDDLDHASIGFSRRGLPSASLYWQRGEQWRLPFSLPGEEEDQDELGLQRTKIKSLGAQVSHRFGSAQAALNFDRSKSSLVDVPLSAQQSDRLSLSLSRLLGRQSTISLRQSWLASARAQANAQQVGQQTDILATYDFSKGARLLLGLQRQDVRSGLFGGNRLISTVGVQFPLSRSMSIGLSLRSFLCGPGNPDDKLQIRVRRLFNFGPTRAANARTSEQRRTLGRIQGRIFDDQNNNGRRDAGEPPLAGVTFALRRNIEASSDAQGLFLFADLSPRPYTLSLVTRTLPLEFAVMGAGEVLVPVASQQTAVIDFPAVRAGQIQGVVFEDADRDGQRGLDEKVMPDAMVVVEGSEVISFSNARGEFTLANLPPRRWKVTVNVAHLGGGFQMTGPSEVEVAPNAAVRGVLLGVAPAPPEVTSSFTKSQPAETEDKILPQLPPLSQATPEN